jgi:hypothetical protein
MTGGCAAIPPGAFSGNKMAFSEALPPQAKARKGLSPIKSSTRPALIKSHRFSNQASPALPDRRGGAGASALPGAFSGNKMAPSEALPLTAKVRCG